MKPQKGDINLKDVKNVKKTKKSNALNIPKTCKTCKYGYIVGYDDFHELCGAEHCYLCAMDNTDENGNMKCEDYTEENIPKNSLRKGYELIRNG